MHHMIERENETDAFERDSGTDVANAKKSERRSLLRSFTSLTLSCAFLISSHLSGPFLALRTKAPARSCELRHSFLPFLLPA